MIFNSLNELADYYARDIVPVMISENCGVVVLPSEFMSSQQLALSWGFLVVMPM